MKATEARLLDFLKKSPQFVIPIYQRTYSWTEKECRQLWADILRVGSQERVAVHFIGSIVYIESGLSSVTHQAPLLVIDGQQRLTSVTLLLAALAEAIGDAEPFDGFSQRKIRNYYLRNPEESGDRHFKLLLTQTDRTTLTALVGEAPLPADQSLRVLENFQLFQNLIKSATVPLPVICRGLAKLVVVDIALSRDQDNPQLIFESMNSTGKELSQADLIRNYILMGLAPELQTKLYENYWRPMEVDFGQEGYSTHFDAFMRHYLTVRTGEIPNIGEVYEAFKLYAQKADSVEELVKEIRTYSVYFCSMALKAESAPDLRQVFHDLRELRVEVAYPLLLELYHDYATEKLSKADFLSCLRLIESYVFRRAICAIPTNSMNKTFAGFAKFLNKDKYLESLQAQFMLLPSYRRFPGNDEFHREIQTRDLYNIRTRSYWLRRFENFDRKEYVPVDEYTIEHILPQNPELSPAWRSELGPEAERIQETWLHTLGNLTLTGYNSEYSDRPFGEKRDMQGGYRDSPLRLNKGLAQFEKWNEDSIKVRAKTLADQAILVWTSPQISPEVLKTYQPEKGKTTTYSQQDHQYLSIPKINQLFEALRSKILALDPCVTETFLKLYIAYKAETNFVDIIPQAKRLLLTINLPFSELVDPHNLCRDVSAMKRWGNGDVEVFLDSLDQIPYIMGLIRQGFEKQMGDQNEL